MPISRNIIYLHIYCPAQDVQHLIKDYETPEKKKQHKNNCQETKQSTEPDSKMTQILDLTDERFKIATMEKLESLMEKVYSMHKKMGIFSKEMET